MIDSLQRASNLQIAFRLRNSLADVVSYNTIMKGYNALFASSPGGVVATAVAGFSPQSGEQKHRMVLKDT